MRIALISEYNAFTTTGGTEYYTSMLANGLVQQGHEILFISRGAQDSAPDEQVIQIAQSNYTLLLLPAEQYDATEIQQKKTSRTWQYILPALQKFQPEVVHVHTLSTFFNVRHFEELAKYYRNIAFTAHVAGHFCLAGGFIRNQRTPCNGKIGFQCKVCLFHYSWRRALSNVINNHSSKRLQILHSLVSAGIHVVCVSDWQREQMLINGYPQGLLSVIKQALQLGNPSIHKSKPQHAGKLRVGYLGRLSPEKGSPLLFSVIERIVKYQSVQFVLGIPSNSKQEDMVRLHGIQHNNQSKVEILMNVTDASKEGFFASIDVLFIPSFVMETGPIVLLEAVYHGTMVLAPNVGSPVELGAAYPELIQFYNWNDEEDVVNCLLQLSKAQVVPNYIYTDAFADRQRTFVKQHIDLYSRVLDSNRN